ncbi:hypothetical protein ABIB25_005396 [Nakamurella sp. UYEF19]
MFAGLVDEDLVAGDPADGLDRDERDGGPEAQHATVLHSQKPNLSVLGVDQQVRDAPDFGSVDIDDVSPSNVLGWVCDSLSAIPQLDQY